MNNLEYYESSIMNVNGKNIIDNEMYLSKKNNKKTGYIKKGKNKKKLSKKQLKTLLKKFDNSKHLKLSKKRKYHLENHTNAIPFKYCKSKKRKKNRKNKKSKRKL